MYYTVFVLIFLSYLFWGVLFYRFLFVHARRFAKRIFPPKSAGWPALFTICCCKLGFNFVFVMYCVNEGRNLRNGSYSACWGNVCLYKGTEARSCGYFGNVSLCKKHHSEKTRANKQSCSFPFKSSTECAGTIVTCPQRLLSVFDRFPTTAKPGTYICLKHLTSADQDQEICAQEEYHPPRKVQSRSPFFFVVVVFS